MAVRGKHRIFNHVAHDFTARQFTRIDLAPLRQQLARGGFIAVVQGIAYVGEIVAELAKTQRDIENGDAPDKG